MEQRIKGLGANGSVSLESARSMQNGEFRTKEPARWLPPLAVALVALAVYANSLGGAFVIDDVPQIQQNPLLDGVHRVREIFSAGVWDFEGRASSYYRPMMYMVYLGTALLVGKSPFAFHVVNVFLHALASVAVFFATRAVTRSLEGEERVVRWAPFVAAMLFAVHPVHTEPVAWIAGLPDLAFGSFAFVAIALYADGPRRPAFLVGSAAAYLVAMLFKEPAVPLPVALVVLDLLRDRGAGQWRRLCVRMLPFAIALALYVSLRVHALGGFAPTAADLGLDLSTRFRIVIALAGRYLVALVWPFPLNFWHAFEVPGSWSQGAVLTGITALAVFVAGLSFSRRRPLLLWSLVAIVPPLLPAFALRGLNQGLENVFAERYLYVPSFGFVLAVAVLTVRFAGRSRARAKFVTACCAALVVGWGAAVVTRNPVWRDSVSLWGDVVSKSPHSGIARENHGFALLATRRPEKAQEEFREALALRPDLPDLARAKADHYARIGLTQKAVFAYHAALTLRPGDVEARVGLASQYEVLGWMEMAESEYRSVLLFAPGQAEIHNRLGIVLAGRGDLEGALAQFEEAVRLEPRETDYRQNRDRAAALAAGRQP